MSFKNLEFVTLTPTSKMHFTHFTQNLSHSQTSSFQASESNRGNDLKFAKTMEN